MFSFFLTTIRADRSACYSVYWLGWYDCQSSPGYMELANTGQCSTREASHAGMTSKDIHPECPRPPARGSSELCGGRRDEVGGGRLSRHNTLTLRVTRGESILAANPALTSLARSYVRIISTLGRVKLYGPAVSPKYLAFQSNRGQGQTVYSSLKRENVMLSYQYVPHYTHDLIKTCHVQCAYAVTARGPPQCKARPDSVGELNHPLAKGHAHSDPCRAQTSAPARVRVFLQSHRPPDVQRWAGTNGLCQLKVSSVICEMHTL